MMDIMEALTTRGSQSSEEEEDISHGEDISQEEAEIVFFYNRHYINTEREIGVFYFMCG